MKGLYTVPFPSTASDVLVISLVPLEVLQGILTPGTGLLRVPHTGTESLAARRVHFTNFVGCRPFGEEDKVRGELSTVEST